MSTALIVVLLALTLGQQDKDLTVTLPSKPGQPPVTLTCERVSPELVMFAGDDLAVGFGATCAAAVHDWQLTPPPTPITYYTI